MLAGAFALAARPFLGEHRLLKPLVMLWLGGQNVALGLSAMLRLNLYVGGEYGLTYLRIHAGIWMGLVVLGLGLTAWQILRARSNGWLVLRAAGWGGGDSLCLLLCQFRRDHYRQQSGDGRPWSGQDTGSQLCLCAWTDGGQGDRTGASAPPWPRAGPIHAHMLA